MKAIVLAGGLGSRLKDRIPDLPKPMAPVGGRPFLEYVLDCLIAGGVTEIILSVGYRADAVMSHFGGMYRNAVVDYAVETEPLGTGGAIAHALKGRGDDPVLVLNGDTFLGIDYQDLVSWYADSGSSVAMVLRAVQDTDRYGSVLVSGGLVSGFVEKGVSGPGLINAGIYIIDPAIFEKFGLSGKFSFEIDLLQKHCKMLSSGAFVTDAYFIDIGTPDSYERAQRELPTVGRNLE